MSRFLKRIFLDRAAFDVIDNVPAAVSDITKFPHVTEATSTFTNCEFIGNGNYIHTHDGKHLDITLLGTNQPNTMEIYREGTSDLTISGDAAFSGTPINAIVFESGAGTLTWGANTSGKISLIAT